tara:strand:+ start:854 stop:1333 length:480 start_codon:yes stop_codon:yes gene_type:complete
MDLKQDWLHFEGDDVETKGNKYVKIIGALFIVVLMGFFAKSLVNPTDVVVADDRGDATGSDADHQSDTDDKSGFQEVYLSWGLFNYDPKVITVKKDMPVRITADTERLTGCYRSFIIEEFNVRKSFNEKNKVLEFTPDKSGEYTFGCAMGMGNGKFIVE